MLNYGDNAFNSISQLQPNADLEKLIVVNCGYFSASNAPYRHHRFEDHAMILYQHKGHAKITINNKSYSFSEGSIAIFPPKSNQNIYYYNDKLNERYYIFFNGTKINEILYSLNLNDFIYNLGTFNEFIDTTLDLLNDFKINQFGNSTYKNILLLNLFAKIQKINSINKNTPSSTTLITPALLHMQQNFKEKYLSTGTYAKMCVVSKNTFVKYFKKLTNNTPVKYFLNLKINNAIQQLTNTNRTINEIAYDLNFEDPLYFSRVFKKFTGFSPSHYRNKSIQRKKQL